VEGDRLDALADCRTRGAGAPSCGSPSPTPRRMAAGAWSRTSRRRTCGFFERLGWSAYRDPENYLGRTHQPMHITLNSG
jgi:hypothetical protein